MKIRVALAKLNYKRRRSQYFQAWPAVLLFELSLVSKFSMRRHGKKRVVFTSKKVLHSETQVMQINIYISPTSGEIEYRFLSLSSLLCLNLSFFNSLIYYTRVQLKKKKKKVKRFFRSKQFSNSQISISIEIKLNTNTVRLCLRYRDLRQKHLPIQFPNQRKIPVH